jgi:hypothetical protein
MPKKLKAPALVKRMTCPLCDQRAGINADGTLRKHRMPSCPDPIMPWDYPFRAGPVCKMSNH